MAAGDLTTLANVKTMLGIEAIDVSEDAKLNFWITSQSEFFLHEIDRSLAVASYTETLDGHDPRIRQRLSSSSWGCGFGGGIGIVGGGYALTLRNTPVVSITSITIDGQDVPPGSGANTPNQIDGWTLDGDRIELLGGTYAFTAGIRNNVIVYQAGYAAIPADVAQAVVDLVGFRRAEASHRGQRSKSMDGQTVYFDMDAIPASAQSVIDRYARVKT